MNSSIPPAPFIRLDTAAPDGENRRSYLFQKPAQILTVRPGDNPDRFFRDMEKGLAKGLWAAGYWAYEFGYLLEPKLAPLLKKKKPEGPLAWVGLWEEARTQKSERGTQKRKDGGRRTEIQDFRMNMTKREYGKAIAKIKDYLEAGDTYQVNFTMKSRFRYSGDTGELYQTLRARQPTPYAARLECGDRSILSLSPELFFRLQGGRFTARPMKGTMARGKTAAEDRRRQKALARDPKNRAENLMIVDLIRNDLGRLAQTGTVRPGPLFHVAPYPTLHQMTSTITALRRPGVGWREIFGALFPCGSVTGAPKIRTMQIIAELEREPRGVYTGAIGFISPRGQACLNVAIRTLVIDKKGNGEMGLGSGVVYDSSAAAEYAECLLKGNFLTGG